MGFLSGLEYGWQNDQPVPQGERGVGTSPGVILGLLGNYFVKQPYESLRGLAEQWQSASEGRGFDPAAVQRGVLDFGMLGAPVGMATMPKGSLGTFAGKMAKTADHEALNVAEQMAKVGHIMPFQKIAREIDKNTQGHIDVRGLKDHLSKYSDYYELSDVPISTIDAAQLKGIDPKSARDIGPIVIDGDGVIVDGRHRAAAAIQRGDKTITAYIPKIYSR